MKTHNLKVNETEILNVMESHKWDSLLFEPKVNLDHNDIVFWGKNVHGANYLNLVIQNCTEKKISYDKIIDGQELTEMIISKSPDDFNEIIDLIESIFKNFDKFSI